MKILILSTFFAVLSFASMVMAESGSFCNDRDQRIEFVCGSTPIGRDWVRQADGCYQRDTGMSCSGRGGRGDGRYNPFPAPRDPGYPGYPGRGVVCRADDRGWEEHRSHRSCGECLSLHGRCIETCSISEYRCEAEGFDYRGTPMRFTGQGQDRYQAENEALRNCSYNASRCQIRGCQESENVVSRRECR